MTTVVNTPPASDNSGGSMGMLLGLIVLAIVGYLFFVYGLPAIQRVQVGTPQISVPDKIDVTVKQAE